MRLTKRIIASRKNGARSRGPKTIEGKRRSSINALRHGLLAQCVVLPNESQEVFAMLLQQHVDKLDPADDIEHSAIEEMVAATWRQRRLWAVETRLLANAVAKRPETDDLDRIAGAFSDLARQPELHLIHRYEGRLNHMYQRALQNLIVFSAIENSPANLDSDKPNAVIDLKAGSQLAETSDCQTNLDSNNPNGVNRLDPTSQEDE